MTRINPFGGFHLRHRLVLMGLILLVTGTATLAQSATSPASLRRQINKAFNVGSYEDAASLIEIYLEKRPDDSRMLYNGACAASRLAAYDKAASYLHRAFKAGFRDVDLMRSDPDLKGLRSHDTYGKIFNTLKPRGVNPADDAIEKWRDSYPGAEYRYETDHERKLQYITALDAVAHQAMREMLEAEADHLLDSIFLKPPSYFVLIAVPTPKDADEYFEGNHSIGGLYQHSQRTLVARNIGGSLRHEFFHVMHYGHMERLDQVHRLWIQEGLASLYENYDLQEDGAITFLPNERHNIARARAKSGSLMRWRNLFEMSSDDFMRRANSLYPQVRSMFRFIADRGKLVQWYQTYTRNYGIDPTGRLAFERTFDDSLHRIEREWRKWLVSQDPLDLDIRPGDASLGIRSGINLGNDGVLITDVLPRSAAASVGLRKGDVIVAANGQDTRSMRELQTIIGSMRVGQLIELRIRRDEDYFTVSARLRPLRGGF